MLRLTVSVFFFHPVLHPRFCCCHAQEVTLLLLCFCGFCLCYSGCHTPLSFLSHAAFCAHLSKVLLVNSGRGRQDTLMCLLSNPFYFYKTSFTSFSFTLKPSSRLRFICWWEDGHKNESPRFIIHSIFRTKADSVDQRLHVPPTEGPKTRFDIGLVFFFLVFRIR